MRLSRIEGAWLPREASIEVWDCRDGMAKEAMSRKDIAATVLALASFLLLPLEVRMATDLKEWLSRRGGSMETASSVAGALGKADPHDVSVGELRSTFAPRQTPSAPVTTPRPPSTEAPKPAPRETKPEGLQEKAYWRGMDSSHARELTQETRANAARLIGRVNAMLDELGVSRATVTSGWRPPSYNERLRAMGVPAARNSQHITGQAVDIADPGHTISNMVLGDPSILERHGLWMEDPSRTPTWVHFDLGAGRDPGRHRDGTPRKNRVFKP